MTDPVQQPRLLKARQSQHLGSGVAFNFEDLQRRCEQELSRARQQADEILRRAREEARQTGQNAFTQARQDGYREGLREAEREIQQQAEKIAAGEVQRRLRTALPAVQQLAETLSHERERWLADWETEVIRLAVAIAEKIVRHEIRIHPEVSIELVRETLQMVTGSARLRIRLHPEDEQHMGMAAREMAHALSGVAEVHLVPDETVAPGGCLVETEHGAVDGRLDAQLDRIFRELTGDEETPGADSS